MTMSMYPQQPVAQRNDPQYVAYLEQRIGALEARLPNTKVVAASFFTRAFAIWGHYFVAQFIISLIVGVIAMILGLIFAGSMAAVLSDVIENMQY